VAVRVLRTLLRRDTPTSPSHLRLFLEKVCDSNPTMVRSRGLLGPCKDVDIFVNISATWDHDWHRISHELTCSTYQYAQRGIMKALRYIKLRSYCRSPADLALSSPINPLRCHIPTEGSYSSTAEILINFRARVPIQSSETLDLNRWVLLESRLEVLTPVEVYIAIRYIKAGSPGAVHWQHTSYLIGWQVPSNGSHQAQRLCLAYVK